MICEFSPFFNGITKPVSFKFSQKRGILAETDVNKKMKLNDGSSQSVVQAMFKQQAWFQEQQLKQQKEFQERMMKLLTN